MGIPSLTKRVEQFAKEYTITQLQGHSAIIDGPALAFFAWEQAHTKAGEPRLPSYAEINAEAIEWLKGLEDNQVKVSAIYFDGALPSKKRAQRVNRMEVANQRIRKFRNKYWHKRCPRPTELRTTIYTLLPATLREALQNSPFASRTRIVPGEADEWCARHARNESCCIIFTSDSDLLVYQYGLETIVAMFRGLDVLANFKAYCPRAICEQLGLSTFVPFAFQVYLGNFSEVGDLVEAAHATDLELKMFREFAERYTLSPTPAQADAPSDNAAFESACQRLDVRFSEFVHQAFQDNKILFVYLPALFEDHGHASAWANSTSTRMAAYSLFAPEGSKVVEYKRVGRDIQKQEVGLLPASELCFALQLTEELAAPFMERMSMNGVDMKLAWFLYAVYLIGPRQSLLLSTISGAFDHSWELVQLIARVQGMLYSFRMLRQSVSLWLVIRQASEGESESSMRLRNSIMKLSKWFDNFPTIADSFWVPGGKTPKMLQSLLLDNIVKAMYPPDIKQPSAKMALYRKNEIDQVKIQRKKEISSAKMIPGNRFEALIDEGC